MPFSRESFQPRDETHISYISCIGRQVLYHQSHLGSLNESVDSGKILSSDPNSQLESSVIFRQITHRFFFKTSYGKYLNSSKTKNVIYDSTISDAVGWSDIASSVNVTFLPSNL